MQHLAAHRPNAEKRCQSNRRLMDTRQSASRSWEVHRHGSAASPAQPPTAERPSARRVRAQAPPLRCFATRFSQAVHFFQPAATHRPGSGACTAYGACGGRRSGRGGTCPVKGDERQLGRFSAPRVGNVSGTSLLRLVCPLNVVCQRSDQQTRLDTTETRALAEYQHPVTFCTRALSLAGRCLLHSTLGDTLVAQSVVVVVGMTGSIDEQ